MSELRAPDPTLTALGDDGTVYLNVNFTKDRDTWGPLPVAHRHPKHAGAWWEEVEVRHARWFAVPCRDCFPDAPPPGHVDQMFSAGNTPSYVPDPDLSWQVTE